MSHKVPLSFGMLLPLFFVGVVFAANSDLPELVEKVEPSVVRIEVDATDGEGSGSGFVVAGGFVVTNFHVIAGARSAKVVFSDGSSAIVRGARKIDVKRDLAALEIDSEARPPLKLSEKLIRKGESVIAVGAPKGFSFTVTEGIVSATRTGAQIKKELDEYTNDMEMKWIQTTAPISQGNSGGPLIDKEGIVVGVNTWTYSTAQNMNFAIASPEVKSFLDDVSSQSLTTLEDIPTSISGTIGSEKSDDIERKLALAVYELYAKPKFELRFSYPKMELEKAAKALEHALWDVSSDGKSEKEKIRFDRAIERVKAFKDFDPGVPKFASTQDALFGAPGNWYVFQVLGPDSMLVKPSKFSDDSFKLEGISSAGKIDDHVFSFDGIWYAFGDTYTYQTVGGGPRTIYVIRDFPVSVEAARTAFQKNHVAQEIEKLLDSVKEPDPPRGKELTALVQRRQEYREEQVRLQEQERQEQLRLQKAEEERLRQEERERRERQAHGKLVIAKRFKVTKPELVRKRLVEIVANYRDTEAALEAGTLLEQIQNRKLRTWTSGKYQTRAVLLHSLDGHAILRMSSGKLVSIALDRLSIADQEYIRTHNN